MFYYMLLHFYFYLYPLILVMLNRLLLSFLCGIWVTQKPGAHFMHLLWIIKFFCICIICMTFWLLEMLTTDGYPQATTGFVDWGSTARDHWLVNYQMLSRFKVCVWNTNTDWNPTATKCSVDPLSQWNTDSWPDSWNYQRCCRFMAWGFTEILRTWTGW